MTRETRAPYAPLAQKTPRTTAPAAKDYAWPGVTRAQLRDHIIEQIG
ncbi:hypothetical protein [Caulobacter sp.]|nr:hypothetical protein [Caulobacter sp.]HJV42524.1 hypothetical protein [Caulobacter sp.]